MWYVEEFGEDDFLVRNYAMPEMDDATLSSLIEIQNTEDWLRGVGHPIATDELQKFANYVTGPLVPNSRHAYFAAYLSD